MRNRLKAFIIDDILITVISLFLFWEQIVNSNGELAVIMEILNSNLWQLILLKFFYQTFFIWYYGATLGKMYAKIRVIDYNNFGRVNIFNASIRAATRVFSEMFFYIGFVVAYFNQEKQTFHDKVGKTLVVNA